MPIGIEVKNASNGRAIVGKDAVEIELSSIKTIKATTNSETKAICDFMKKELDKNGPFCTTDDIP